MSRFFLDVELYMPLRSVSLIQESFMALGLIPKHWMAVFSDTLLSDGLTYGVVK